jgi:two-component system CheB/CheR fusion protein
MNKIILIEDHLELLNMLQESLELEGIDVVATTSPLRALERLQAKPHAYEMVILDFNLPHMKGDKLLNHLNENYPHLKTIMVGGDAEIMQNMADRHLLKPFTPEELIDLIREISPLIINNITREQVLKRPDY